MIEHVVTYSIILYVKVKRSICDRAYVYLLQDTLCEGKHPGMIEHVDTYSIILYVKVNRFIYDRTRRYLFQHTLSDG